MEAHRQTMSSPRFYIPAEFSEGDLIQLPQDEAVHALRVLRLEEGDTITLLNGKGAKAEAILSTDGERDPRPARSYPYRSLTDHVLPSPFT